MAAVDLVVLTAVTDAITVEPLAKFVIGAITVMPVIVSVMAVMIAVIMAAIIIVPLMIPVIIAAIIIVPLMIIVVIAAIIIMPLTITVIVAVIIIMPLIISVIMAVTVILPLIIPVIMAVTVILPLIIPVIMAVTVILPLIIIPTTVPRVIMAFIPGKPPPVYAVNAITYTMAVIPTAIPAIPINNPLYSRSFVVPGVRRSLIRNIITITINVTGLFPRHFPVYERTLRVFWYRADVRVVIPLRDLGAQGVRGGACRRFDPGRFLSRLAMPVSQEPLERTVFSIRDRHSAKPVILTLTSIILDT